LIELLVVVAIIGILASILLPSLQKARKKVKQAVCLSNQRQIAIATMSYAADNDQFGPRDEAQQNGKRFHDKLIPNYLPEGPIAWGPSPVAECPDGVGLDRPDGSNIGMNMYVTGKNQSGWGDVTPIKITGSQSDTVLLMDSYDYYRSVGPRLMTLAYLIEDGETKKIARHLEKANVTHLDGSGIARSYNFLLTKNNSDDTFWDPEK
jgi:type II secretory pathway pseudopilin PulG